MQHLEPEALPKSAELGVHDLIITLHGTHCILHGTQTRCLTRLQLLTEHITSHISIHCSMLHYLILYITRYMLHGITYYITHHILQDITYYSTHCITHYLTHHIAYFKLHIPFVFTSNSIPLQTHA